jgi:hypothetical protein
MKESKTPSARREKITPLTPEQRYEAEKRLARLLISAHDEGVPAAMEEWHRMRAAMRAKAQNSPANRQPNTPPTS